MVRTAMLARYAAAAVQATAAAITRRNPQGHVDRMDDRMLRDIGLTRQDVWSVAAEPLFRGCAVDSVTGRNRHPSGVQPTAQGRMVRTALRRLWAAENRAT